jgi:hypothetical protein
MEYQRLHVEGREQTIKLIIHFFVIISLMMRETDGLKQEVSFYQSAYRNLLQTVTETSLRATVRKSLRHH